MKVIQKVLKKKKKIMIKYCKSWIFKLVFLLKCKVEEWEIDCLCCQELAALNEKLDVEENATCITETEEFRTL